MAAVLIDLPLWLQKPSIAEVPMQIMVLRAQDAYGTRASKGDNVLVIRDAPDSLNDLYLRHDFARWDETCSARAVQRCNGSAYGCISKVFVSQLPAVH